MAKGVVPALLAFALGAVYVLGVLVALPTTDACRWVQNNPGCSLFLLVFFPLSMYLFGSSFRRDYVRLSDSARWLWFIIFVLAVLLVSIMTVQDMLTAESRTLTPYHLKNGTAVVEFERTLRQTLRGHDASEQWVNAIQEYRRRIPRFESLRDLLTRGTFVAQWELVVNLLGGWVTAAILWYLLLLLRSSVTVEDNLWEKLVVGLALMLTWVPMRLYSEWYINLYSLEHLRHYTIFGVVALSGAVAIVALIVLKTPRRVPAIFSAILTFLAGTATLVGYVRPHWIQPVASMFESFSFTGFLLFDLILFAFAAAVATRFTANPPPTAPPSQAT